MIQRHALTLVLGHAASGKSRAAEALVEAAGASRLYVATARAWDPDDDGEMRAKIAAHAARRGPGWRTVEAPEAIADAVRGVADPILVDCATMWLANREGAPWEDAAERWIAAARDAPGPAVVVSNDVGGGIVPANAMARAFQREQGALNQRLAEAADRVALVTAGLVQWLK